MRYVQELRPVESLVVFFVIVLPSGFVIVNTTEAPETGPAPRRTCAVIGTAAGGAKVVPDTDTVTDMGGGDGITVQLAIPFPAVLEF